MIGPGKHDELCTYIRKALDMGNTGGVILIVIGDGINGFSCQADLPTTLMMPDLLEQVATTIRTDQQAGKL